MGRRTIALGIVLVVLIAAPTSSAATWLSTDEARAAIYKRIEPKRKTILRNGLTLTFTDWNVSRCFRLATNRVQCRWSWHMVVSGPSFETRLETCFGNARATKTGTRVLARFVGLPTCPGLY